MQYKIGFITSYSRMESDFKDLAETEQCNLIFRVGVMEYAIDLAREMENSILVDAIISTEVTGEIIAKHVNVPVIPLRVKGYNLIEALFRAHAMGQKVAFADIAHKYSVFDLERVAGILGYHIRHYKFNHPDEAVDVVEKIASDEQDVIVTTASCTMNIAKRHNMRAVLIEPTRHDLVEAINLAKRLVDARRKEQENLNWLNAVINNINEGIITVNEGRVSSVNSYILSMLALGQDKLIGREISDIMEISPLLKKIFNTTNNFEIIKHGDKDLVISRKEIYANNDVLGSIYKIEILQNIQQIEMEARKKSLKSGFIAAATFDQIAGISAAINEAKDKAKHFALTDSYIFINGESGTGKEVFAQSIHNYSPCRQGPFVAINCATLPEQLLDSELFGFEDGVFTGARKGGKPGLFEMAHNGTLFLDEIGEMPLLLQTKLLRVLQEKMIRRVGGDKNIPVNVRLIFATNKNLREEVKKGSFREDLFYRIHVLNLKLPPLRERPEDIQPLARHIINKIIRQRQAPGSLSERGLAVLMRYDWPGNVRELHNFLERVIAMSSQHVYDAGTAEQLMRELVENSRPKAAESGTGSDGDGAKDAGLAVPLSSMHDMQDSIIRHIYARFDGDRKKVENILQMSRTTLWRRFKEMGL
ncbi:MAG: sigma 54-interacting transcriptional regulator [Deltaproteobacteria bacterium]|nr:sigma 54-interacting transcriptional regulator [Deltaproteobacteria bacterium]